MGLVEKRSLAFKAIELAETTRTYFEKKLCADRLRITWATRRPSNFFWPRKNSDFFLKSKKRRIENFSYPSSPIGVIWRRATDS
jgi:hypothetical protein